MTPLSVHAIEQFRTRVFKTNVMTARAILHSLAVEAKSAEPNERCEYHVRYDDTPVVLVIRDGYVVTCWKDKSS